MKRIPITHAQFAPKSRFRHAAEIAAGGLLVAITFYVTGLFFLVVFGAGR